MKILIIDIETSPSLAYVWGLWDQNVGLNQLVDTTHVMCFAAKWYGEKKVYFHSDYHDGHTEMVKKAHEMMDEADAIVHYNGKNFDIKHLNREFLLAELPPPSPHKDIDLLTTARSRFRFQSNKLQHISTQLGFPGKQDAGGFTTWIKCLAEDPKAWATMRKYNIADVIETEKVYKKLLPWIKSHPSQAIYNDDPTIQVCTKCNGTHLQKRGFYRTNASVFQQYQCQNPKCMAWNRDSKRIVGTKIQQVS